MTTNYIFCILKILLLKINKTTKNYNNYYKGLVMLSDCMEKIVGNTTTDTGKIK